VVVANCGFNRGIKPPRIDAATRINLALLSRLCDRIGFRAPSSSCMRRSDFATRRRLRTPGASLACRAVSREAAKGRWLMAVPESKKTDLIPADWFEAWADATFATDSVGAASTPPVLRAPNGVAAAGRAC